jgi:phospholipid/cholesterol/gamma-HCH transport system substrate-binding protein
MERNAHYALVGLISMVLFIGLVVFVVWLARLQFSRQYDNYDVDFAGPVRGLSSGGEVYFNGIKVGEVTRLSLDKTDPNRVVARVRIDSDAPVRVDSTASLEPLGITGVNYIQITAGDPKKPLLRDATPSGKTPVIHTVRGGLESILEGGGTVLARAVDALDRVNKLLSDKNIETIGSTFDNVNAFTGELRNQRELIAHLDQTLQNSNEAVLRVAELTKSTNDLVNGDGKRTLSNLADAAEEVKAAATDARVLVSKLQGPTTDFATTGLPQISSAVVGLQTAVDSLNRLIGDVEQNPSTLLTKPTAKTIEVKP